MQRALGRLLCGVLLLWALAGTAAQGQGLAEPAAPALPPPAARLALVIGNAAYAEGRLDNPVNDARDMARLLERAGFQVMQRENLGLREMHLALREFGDRLRRETLGLFYFAGHGLQVRGRNYLLPVGADIGREDEVAFNALDLQAVLEKMETARNHTNLVILDACRNNPFAARFRLANPGLAQIDAAPGTLVAFATAPGGLASDGGGRNGRYTAALLNHLASPGLQIEEAFKRVRVAVRQASKGAQTPWESTSLESELVLLPLPGGGGAHRPSRTPPAPAVVPAQGPVQDAGPVGAAPQFRVGDWWVWKLTNHLSGEVRQVRRQVVSIEGDRVTLNNGTLRDRSGNTLREVVGGKQRHFRPSTLSYVFPLTPGLRWGGRTVEEGEGHVNDHESTLQVLAEEPLDTAFGRVRAVKVERRAEWTQRRTGRSGHSRWTYWYAARYKGPVRVERTSTTTAGRVYVQETQELVAFGSGGAAAAVTSRKPGSP